LNDQTLKPNNNNNNENKTTIIQSIQQIATDLNNLLNDPELIIINEQHNEINLFLNKSLRYINSALANENENNHFTSYKLLKSAANTLENFLNDIDNNNSQKNILNKKQKLILANLIVKLNENSIHIESTSLLLLDLNNQNNDTSASASTPNVTTNLLPRSDSHVLNDWVLSEFNLLSNDFNSSLAFIAGNLFDLNFNYKLNKTLNISSKCFLMETRNTNAINNKLKFVLKCLQKSSNPDLTVKCQVPTLNQVPFMCQLNKYYESDFTIFLLIDYCNLGRLTDYLDILAEHGSSFMNKLKQNSNQNSNNSSSLKSLRRRKSSTISSHKSVSCLVGLDKLSFNNNNNNNKTIYRTQSLKDYSPVNTLSKQPQSLTKLTEIHLDNIKYIDESTVNIQDKGSSSESSESSESSSRSLSTSEGGGIKSLEPRSTSQNKQSNWSNKLLSNSFRKINSLINKNTKILKTTKILFNNNNNTNEIKEIYSSDDNDNNNNNNDPYLKQVRLWLAQLCLSLKGLHALNIVIKDLRPDNLLLSNDGDCMLTYISRWDLVDEQLNKDAIKFYYAAPELCGSVNYTVTEACDWWSFGVLAYELITMNVRNNNNNNKIRNCINLFFVFVI